MHEYVVSVKVKTGAEWAVEQITELIEIALGTTEDVTEVNVRDVVTEG